MLQLNELNRVEDPKSKGQKRYFSNEELLQRYKVYMRKKGLSISSYKSREIEIKGYFRFMAFINQKTIYRLNGDTLAGYLEYLRQNNFTVNTQERKLKDLSAFYTWLKEEKIIGEKDNIFNNGFCVFSYINNLKRTYAPDKTPRQPSSIRRQMLIYIDKFIAYYLNKGYCEGGTVIYKRELKRFIGYLEQNADVDSIKDITKNILSEYQIYLHRIGREDGQPYSVSSKQKKLVVIRKFFQFLVRYDYLDNDPSTIIELPRLERGLPTAMITDRELDLLLKAPDLSRPQGIRDKAIMMVLYSTGARNDELCHIKISDINFEDGLVTISHPKGGVGFQRVVPIGKTACEAVKQYLSYARPSLLNGAEDCDYLFLNNFGTRLKKTVLTKYMFQYRLKTNIRNKITAHSFRVTCATGMLKNKADVRYIQEQLGHRSLRSTQIYTRVFPHDLKKVHSMTHPLEKTYKKPSGQNICRFSPTPCATSSSLT